MTNTQDTEETLAMASFHVTLLINHLNGLIPTSNPTLRLKYAALRLKLEDSFKEIEQFTDDFIKEQNHLEKQAQIQQEEPKENLSDCCSAKINEQWFCKECRDHAE